MSEIIDFLVIGADVDDKRLFEYWKVSSLQFQVSPKIFVILSMLISTSFLALCSVISKDFL